MKSPARRTFTEAVDGIVAPYLTEKAFRRRGLVFHSVTPQHDEIFIELQPSQHTSADAVHFYVNAFAGTERWVRYMEAITPNVNNVRPLGLITGQFGGQLLSPSPAGSRIWAIGSADDARTRGNEVCSVIADFLGILPRKLALITEIEARIIDLPEVDASELSPQNADGSGHMNKGHYLKEDSGFVKWLRIR